MFEHILTQFWNHIESRWRQAAIWSLIEPDYVTERAKIVGFLKYELENFLKFFPVWLAIVHKDEEYKQYNPLLLRADKRYKEKIRRSNRKETDKLEEQKTDDEYIETVSLEDHVGSPDNDLKFIDILASPTEEKRDYSKLSRYIGELPERQKQIIVAYYFEELSQKELAKKLGISQSAVNQRLVYAISLLKKKYNSE
jgi:RNA polymerase sigma factor (sigma-70 family)